MVGGLLSKEFLIGGLNFLIHVVLSIWPPEKKKKDSSFIAVFFLTCDYQGKYTCNFSHIFSIFILNYEKSAILFYQVLHHASIINLMLLSFNFQTMILLPNVTCKRFHSIPNFPLVSFGLKRDSLCF